MLLGFLRQPNLLICKPLHRRIFYRCIISLNVVDIMD